MKSKYGYHYCDYDTFTKLKQLKKFYYESQHQLFNWFRWDRKQDQNKIGLEPKYPDLFISNEHWKTSATRTDKSTQKPYIHYKYYNRKLDDFGILELYEKARIPNAEPVELFDQSTLDKINRLYVKMK